MRGNSFSFLAAKKALTGALLVGAALPGVCAGAVPVIDVANLRQSSVTAREAVAQTLKQIEQYKNQLKQYQLLKKNATLPKDYQWDQAVATLRQLQTAIDVLGQLRQQVGDLDAYLAQFKDLDGHRADPCLHQACSPDAYRQAADATLRLGAQARKHTNDALLKGVDQQQQALRQDAQQLQGLQKQAGQAIGQMQALGAANQLSSHQAHQLLQLRALLLAQQTAEATRQQVLADREARQLAAHAVSTQRRIAPTLQPMRWSQIRP